MNKPDIDVMNHTIRDDEGERDHVALMEMCEEFKREDEFDRKFEKYMHVYRCMNFSDDLCIQFLMGWDEARRIDDEFFGRLDIDEAADYALKSLGLGEYS